LKHSIGDLAKKKCSWNAKDRLSKLMMKYRLAVEEAIRQLRPKHGPTP
jgi:hypothetical protein